MIYVNPYEPINEPNTKKSAVPHTAKATSFDSVFETETVIFAKPESKVKSRSTPVTVSDNPPSPREWEPFFQRASATYDIDINLLKAVAYAESNFHSNTVSSAGAIGVMQLMPDTAADLGVADPYQPEDNIMGGAKYLSQLMEKYQGNLSLTLAAYNAGVGNVDKYQGIPPFRETENYVKKVLDYYNNPDASSHDTSIYAVAAGSESDDGTVVATLHAVASGPAKDSASSSVAASIYAVAAKDIQITMHQTGNVSPT